MLRGIYGAGYECPSVIQQKAIKPLIDGRDLLHRHNLEWKNCIFNWCFREIDDSKNETQAVVLAHTRELALQIKEVITTLAQIHEYD